MLTLPGSDAYMLCDSIATELELFEFQALAQTKAILPDQADTDSLNRHGAVEGISRRLASPASVRVTITGTPSQTVTFGTAVLTYHGVSYGKFANADTGAPIASVALTGGGGPLVPVLATALTNGAYTTVPVGTALTWSSTPANANATAVVSVLVASGEDDEADLSYALRIMARRRERPASGNNADWKDWAESVDGVDVAFVYPLLQYLGFGPNTRGAVTVAILGPPQGNINPFNTRIIPALVDRVKGYIEGTNDIHGNAGVFDQLRPVTIPEGTYTIAHVNELYQVVAITLTMAAAYPFPWTSPAYYTVTGWNNTTKVLTLSALPSSVEVGDTVAIRDGFIRGLYAYGKVAAVSTVSNQITMDASFSSTTIDTTATGRLRPVPESATSLRDAIFAYFNELGPGDTSPPSRWPGQQDGYRTTMYRSALAAAAIHSGAGVLSANVTTPSTDVNPAALEIVTVTELILSP